MRKGDRSTRAFAGAERRSLLSMSYCSGERCPYGGGQMLANILDAERDHIVAELERRAAATEGPGMPAIAQGQIDLYERRPLVALKRLADKRSDVEAALILHVQSIRIHFLDLQARALFAAGVDADDDRFVAEADVVARRLFRERVPAAKALAHAVAGGIAIHRRRLRDAATSLKAAQDGFRAAGMKLHSATVGWQAALLSDDMSAIDENRRCFLAENVKEPERLAHVFARLLESRF